MPSGKHSGLAIHEGKDDRLPSEHVATQPPHTSLQVTAVSNFIKHGFTKWFKIHLRVTEQPIEDHGSPHSIAHAGFVSIILENREHLYCRIHRLSGITVDSSVIIHILTIRLDAGCIFKPLR